MASGHGVPKPDTAGHPNRQVGRHVFQPGDLHVRESTPHKGGTLTWSRPAYEGPTQEGGPIDTATHIVPQPETPWQPKKWSKPNPGGYSPDEISNIRRNSGP